MSSNIGTYCFNLVKYFLFISYNNNSKGDYLRLYCYQFSYRKSDYCNGPEIDQRNKQKYEKWKKRNQDALWKSIKSYKRKVLWRI